MKTARAIAWSVVVGSGVILGASVVTLAQQAPIPAGAIPAVPTYHFDGLTSVEVSKMLTGLAVYQTNYTNIIGENSTQIEALYQKLKAQAVAQDKAREDEAAKKAEEAAKTEKEKKPEQKKP